MSSQLRDQILVAECIILNVNCDKMEELENELKQLSEETGKEAQIVESYLNVCA